MAATGREFFTAKTVAEALSGFPPAPTAPPPRPSSLEEAAGRVPVADILRRRGAAGV